MNKVVPHGMCHGPKLTSAAGETMGRDAMSKECKSKDGMGKDGKTL